jgi:hypothetical protein
LAARASTGKAIVLLPLWRAPTVVAITLGFVVAHSIEYLGMWWGENPYGINFMLLSPIFNLVPLMVPTVTAVVAARQKMRFTKQLKEFKVSNAKCFAASDRPVVEGAIVDWFKDPNGKSNSDADCIGRFEASVREGRTFRTLMGQIGQQPGLLRASDLAVALTVPWALTCCDMTVYTPLELGHGGFWALLVVLPSCFAAFMMHAVMLEWAVLKFDSIPVWASAVFGTPLLMVFMIAVVMPLSWVCIAKFGTLP